MQKANRKRHEPPVLLLSYVDGRITPPQLNSFTNCTDGQ